MPKGQFYALTGTLSRSYAYTGFAHYAIDPPTGLSWILQINRNVDHLLGRTVHIEGVRWDYAIIDVDRIWAEGDPRPIFWWERLSE